MIKNLLLALILAVGGISMVACESNRGVSRDMDRAGDKMEDVADDIGDGMEKIADDLD